MLDRCIITPSPYRGRPIWQMASLSLRVNQKQEFFANPLCHWDKKLYKKVVETLHLFTNSQHFKNRCWFLFIIIVCRFNIKDWKVSGSIPRQVKKLPILCLLPEAGLLLNKDLTLVILKSGYWLKWTMLQQVMSFCLLL